MMVVKIDVYWEGWYEDWNPFSAILLTSPTQCLIRFISFFLPENPLMTQQDQRWVRLPNRLFPLGLLVPEENGEEGTAARRLKAA